MASSSTGHGHIEVPHLFHNARHCIWLCSYTWALPVAVHTSHHVGSGSQSMGPSGGLCNAAHLAEGKSPTPGFRQRVQSPG